MTAVDLTAFIEKLADLAGQTILPFFRTAIGAEDKSGGSVFDPVTEADRAAEVAMRRLIRETFGHHGIVGEEFGSEREDAEYVWVLDPIDGTKSFISGFPTWGTLIGLVHQGRPIYGAMAQPFTREYFFGDGQIATWRGPRARSCADATPPLCARLRTAFAGDLADDLAAALSAGATRQVSSCRAAGAAVALRL